MVEELKRLLSGEESIALEAESDQELAVIAAAENRNFPPVRGMVTLDMGLLERITVEDGKCGGRPCIRGKRIRVTDILDLLSHGATHQEILSDYPFLEEEDILAAIAYAARQTDHVVLATK